MDFAARKRYFNLCDPLEPLEPGDLRNVDIDREGAQPVRGVVWSERLAQRIELSDQPVLELFSGLPGSGKSTELKRLVQRLEDPNKADLLAVLIDAEQTLDLTTEIDIPDLLAVVVHELERAVLRLERKDPDQALRDGFVRRIFEQIKGLSWKSNELGLDTGLGAALVLELKASPTLRKQFRERIAAGLPSFLAEVRSAVAELKNRAIAAGRNGVVVLIDSLEKLRGSSHNYEAVIDSAEKILKGGAPYLELPVHCLYMVPAALYARGIRVEMLPMIKLRTSAGRSSNEGILIAREIIRRRVPDEVLRDVLGPQCEKRLRELILWSGGYPRELVRMTQAIFTHERFPLEAAALRRIRTEIADSYRTAILGEDFAWLAAVHLDKFVTIESDSERRSADRMLTMNAVLRYDNDEAWWDIHPAVATIPGVKKSIDRLRAQRARGAGEHGA